MLVSGGEVNLSRTDRVCDRPRHAGSQCATLITTNSRETNRKINVFLINREESRKPNISAAWAVRVNFLDSRFNFNCLMAHRWCACARLDRNRFCRLSLFALCNYFRFLYFLFANFNGAM